MLHILWIILKWILLIIGVILGLVLGILLLLLLLLLFCPVRYQAFVKKWEKQIQGNVGVSWLFGALSFCVSYEVGGSPQIGIRLFGVSLDKLRSLLKKTEGRKQKPKKKREEEKTAALPDRTVNKETVQTREPEKPKSAESEVSDSEENSPKEIPEKTETKTEPEQAGKVQGELEAEEPPKIQEEALKSFEEQEPEKSFEQDADKGGVQSAKHSEQVQRKPEDESMFAEDKSKFKEDRPRQTLFKRLAEIIKKIVYKIKGIFQKFSAFYKTICTSAEKAQAKVQELIQKISRWKHFLEEEHTRGALLLLKKQGKRVLFHLLPTHISGHVTLGLEEPSQMGAVLAVLGMTIPFHKNCIAVTPVYDRNMLEGEAALKGRVYGFVLVWAALRLWFDKNITYVRKHWKQKEEVEHYGK